MALNRAAVRTDIGYLSRRRKTAADPAPAQLPTRHAAPPSSTGLTLGTSPAPSSSSPAPPSSGGLTLGASPAATRPKRAPSASDRLFPAPGFGSVRELNEENPVVRLNARQSAIGSLLVAGIRSVTWEDRQFTTGAHHADGHRAGTAVLTPGNRHLAGMQDGAGIVSLRHVRLLRRLLFVGGDTPMTVGVFDGAAAAVAARNDAGLRSVLYVGRIGPILELRAEFVPADASDAAIWAMFGFTMTIPLDQRVLPR